MNELKKKAIVEIIDSSIKSFAMDLKQDILRM